MHTFKSKHCIGWFDIKQTTNLFLLLLIMFMEDFCSYWCKCLSSTADTTVAYQRFVVHYRHDELPFASLPSLVSPSSSVHCPLFRNFHFYKPFSLSSSSTLNCSRKFTHTDPGYDRVGKIGKDGSPMTILDIARQGDQAFEGPVTYSFCATCEVCIGTVWTLLSHSLTYALTVTHPSLLPSR